MRKKIYSREPDRNTSVSNRLVEAEVVLSSWKKTARIEPAFDELGYFSVLVRRDQIPSSCCMCGKPSKAYNIRGKQSWMEEHLHPDPPARRFWQFVGSQDANISFCSQECCTACVDKYKMEYLMYLTTD